MEQPIAYCGLECLICPAYIAKQNNDNELRVKTAKSWSSHGFEVEPNQVNCDGCHSNGQLIEFCSKCAVRNCAIERSLDTCADCSEYPCADKLEKLWGQIKSPQAKSTLEKLHNLN
ncbi:MAG: DUF3795 domain-containing protein [Candidatus Hodarchaeota archaeon]